MIALRIVRSWTPVELPVGLDLLDLSPLRGGIVVVVLLFSKFPKVQHHAKSACGSLDSTETWRGNGWLVNLRRCLLMSVAKTRETPTDASF